MLNRVFLFITSVIVLVLASNSFAQKDGSKKANLARGTVSAVGEKKVVVKTANGAIDALILSTTSFKRLPPDNLSLKAAVDSKLSDISVGDQVVVVGTFPKSKTDMITKTVYLLKDSDLAEVNKKRQQEWRRRGISGRVTAVNTETKEISVLLPEADIGAVKTIKLKPKNDVRYLRYSPKSIKYPDAVKSSFDEIKKQDVINALGDKSADGKSFKAEEILTGAFVTVAGKVKSIDIEKNEVTITNLKTKKDVTISVNSDSLVKKFPERFAQRMARRASRNTSGRNAGGTAPRRQNNRNASSGQNRNRPNGAGNGGRVDINQMLSRFPTITLKDLKVGDLIAASSPKGSNPSRLTAIKLLAGVEPFIKMAELQSRSGNRRRGGVGSGGFSIPGLDSVSF